MGCDPSLVTAADTPEGSRCEVSELPRAARTPGVTTLRTRVAGYDEPEELEAAIEDVDVLPVQRATLDAARHPSTLSRSLLHPPPQRRRALPCTAT